MEKSLLCFDRRAVRLAPLAVVGAALLAACSTDTPLEPTASRMPTTVQPAIAASASATLMWSTVTIEANKKKLVGGAKFSVTGYRMAWSVTDNGVGDADPVLGKFKLLGLSPGTYKVCETVAPTGYAMSSTPCLQFTVEANGIGGDEFMHLALPHFLIQIVDAQNKLVGGASLTVRNSANVAIMVVVDNDANDIQKTAGFFSVRLPASGSYWVCPNTPPPGYAFTPNQTCRFSQYSYGIFNTLAPFKVVKL